ncbi:MAG: hypothetical protein QF368_20155 [SAR202 cluster bacterium]|nr:hypothetical protein [SAR202 cluster bacterium]
MDKTVLFGPFVGELGWELLYWHGWVRRLAKTEFRDYHRIVASFPGRQPFYPDAHEFWPHPESLLSVLRSPRGHITDYWRDGHPRGNELITRRQFGLVPRLVNRPIDAEIQTEDVEPVVRALLEEYKSQLPESTEFLVPFDRVDLRDDESGKTPFDLQLFERIRPSPAGISALRQIVEPSQRLIAIFPRNRGTRRPDKNWPRERYEQLIPLLSTSFPDHKVAIFGAPNEAHFDNSTPPGTLDLINVANDVRLDLQVAALEQSDLALGSMSGAILFALAAGCPSLTWGWRHDASLYHAQNVLGTRFVYHPSLHITPEEVASLACALIQQPPSAGVGLPDWDSEQFLYGTSLIRQSRQWISSTLSSMVKGR